MECCLDCQESEADCSGPEVWEIEEEEEECSALRRRVDFPLLHHWSSVVCLPGHPALAMTVAA